MNLNFIRDHFAARFYVYAILTIIAGLMSFYYFVYVPKNENDLNQHLVRLLHNKGRTVIEKYKGYSGAINSAPISYLGKWFFKINPEKENIFIAQRNDTLWFTAFSRDTTKFPKGVKIKFFSKTIFNNKARTDPALLPGSRGDNLSLWQPKSGNIHFIYEPGQDIFQIVKGDSLRVQPYIWTQATSFTTTINSVSLFEDLFLVSDQRGITSTSKGFVADGKVIDKSNLGFIEFDIPETKRKEEVGYFLRDVGDVKYRVYYERLNLNRNFNVFLVGMVSQSDFNRQAREVPNWFLIFCLIVALSLIFLLPVLKLLTMNTREHLKSLDARLSVFSLTLCAFLIMTMLVGGYILTTIELPRVDNNLRSIANRMVDSAGLEVKSLAVAIKNQQLFKSDTPAVNTKWFQKTYPKLKFNEVFEIPLESNGKMVKIFYSNSNKEIDLNLFPIDVGSREYFKAIKASHQNENPVDYYLQAINSFTSGKAEVAISTFQEKDQSVRVITSQFKSLVNAIVPAPFKFIVTDHEGNIKIKWDGSGPQGENFIDECNANLSLKALIANRASGFVDFTYITTECRAYSQPILSDWQLTVFYELNETLNLAARIFSLCLFCLGMVALFTGAIHLSLLLDRQRPPILKARSFFYHWLAPDQVDAKSWTIFVLLNIIFIIVLTIWLAASNDFVLSTTLIFICITLFYLLSYRKLKDSERFTPSMVGLTSLLILLAIFFICNASTKHNWILLALLLILVMWWAGAKKLVDKLPEVRKIIIYRGYMLTSIIVISVLPAWIFISINYNHESTVQGYFYLLEDLQKQQIHSAQYNPAQNGVDYLLPVADQGVPYSPINEESIDYSFYKNLRGFQVEGRKYKARHMGLLPNDSLYHLTEAYNYIKIESYKSLVKQYGKEDKPDLALATKISTIGWKWDQAAFSVYLLIVAALGLGVLAVRIIPEKIFFRHFNLWKRYPRRSNQLTALQSEFEHDLVDQHPLHEFESKQQLLEEAALELEAHKNSSERNDYWVYKLMQSAQDVYSAQWNDCTEDEKYFLYDLAQDGIANLTNRELIGGLSQKGLIRLDPHLEIVNRSFANYILNAVDPEVLVERQEIESKEGQWAKMKPILIIVIIAAFGFLSVSNEEFLGRAAALIASIGVLLPNILSTLSSVGNLLLKKGN